MLPGFMRELSFLVTNDDGIESPLLAALVAALLAHGRVTVVAPRTQQSWISKALSRQAECNIVERRTLFGCPAWDLNGTPADCVNLALAHLAPEPVDVVVSGINIGSNAALPLILASGTVGGALEGALHGHHALASSLRLTREDLGLLREPGAKIPPHLATAARLAAKHTAELAEKIGRRPKSRSFVVHSLNFPAEMTPDTPLVRTMPALLQAGPMFNPAEAQTGVYHSAFAVGGERPTPFLTDRACLESGRASHTVLDFGRLGVSGGAFGKVDEVTPTDVAAGENP
jgi:5'-nucleotidase